MQFGGAQGRKEINDLLNVINPVADAGKAKEDSDDVVKAKEKRKSIAELHDAWIWVMKLLFGFCLVGILLLALKIFNINISPLKYADKLLEKILSDDSGKETISPPTQALLATLALIPPAIIAILIIMYALSLFNTTSKTTSPSSNITNQISSGKGGGTPCLGEDVNCQIIQINKNFEVLSLMLKSTGENLIKAEESLMKSLKKVEEVQTKTAALSEKAIDAVGGTLDVIGKEVEAEKKSSENINGNLHAIAENIKSTGANIERTNGEINSIIAVIGDYGSEQGKLANDLRGFKVNSSNEIDNRVRTTQSASMPLVPSLGFIRCNLSPSKAGLVSQIVFYNKDELSGKVVPICENLVPRPRAFSPDYYGIQSIYHETF